MFRRSTFRRSGTEEDRVNAELQTQRPCERGTPNTPKRRLALCFAAGAEFVSGRFVFWPCFDFLLEAVKKRGRAPRQERALPVK